MNFLVIFKMILKFTKKMKVIIISEILLLLLGFFLLITKNNLAVQKYLYISFFITTILLICLDVFSSVFKESFLKTLDFIMFTLRAVAILLFFTLFIVSIRVVIGKSMQDTLQDNDKVLIYHLFYEPKINDIIVFNAPSDDEYVKRIVAGKSDLIEVKIYDDEVEDILLQVLYINNEMVLSPKGQPYLVSKYFDKYYIPDDYYFVLGDNAFNSDDSRTISLIHKSDIIGKVLFK